MHVCILLYIYIYIYIERERARESWGYKLFAIPKVGAHGFSLGTLLGNLDPGWQN